MHHHVSFLCGRSQSTVHNLLLHFIVLHYPSTRQPSSERTTLIKRAEVDKRPRTKTHRQNDVHVDVIFALHTQRSIQARNGWLLNPVYTIQTVVKPVVQPGWQPAVSCKQTSNRLSNLLSNPNWQPVWQQVVSCKRGFRKRPTNRSSHPSIQPVIKLKCRIVYSNLSTERYCWVWKLSSFRLIIFQSLITASPRTSTLEARQDHMCWMQDNFTARRCCKANSMLS